MIFSRKLLVIVFVVEGVKSFLTDKERDILLKFVRKTHVKRVILAPERITLDGGRLVKELSTEKVASVFAKRESLREYLKRTDFGVFPWTAVVLKERDLRSADYLGNSTIVPSFFWLLFDDSNGTLRENIMNVYIPINTAFILVEKSPPDSYVLSEYFQIKKSTPGVFQVLAEWKGGDLKMSQKKWYDRKSNFQGYKLTTVKFNEDLYLTPKEKVNEAIWKELSVLLNFTITHKLIRYFPEKGSVELVKEEDEALMDTAIYIGNTERFRYLLGPTSQSRVYMHVKAEGEYKGLTRFLMPFAKYTWWGVGLWICYCAIVSCIVEYFSGKFDISEKESGETFAMAFVPLDSLCGAKISSNLTSRLMLILIKWSSCVIFHSYGATLISYLLLYIPQLPFTDLRGFVEDGSYKIIGERNSDVDAFFNVSKVPLEKLVYTNFLVDVTEWERLDKEVDRMCAGERLVLVAYDNDVDKYRPCNIVKIKKPLKTVMNGFKIRFRSPLRGLLHVKLLLLRTTGVLKKLNNQILRKTSQMYTTNSTYKVTMERLSSAFYLLLYGDIFAVVILAIEIAVKKMSKQRIGYLEPEETSRREQNKRLHIFLRNRQFSYK